MDICRRIKEARLAGNMTQVQLADRAGYAQVDISRWERRVTPRSDVAPRLAKALGVSVRWLLTGQPDRVLSVAAIVRGVKALGARGPE